MTPLPPLERIENGLLMLQHYKSIYPFLERIEDVVHANSDVFNGIPGHYVYKIAAEYIEAAPSRELQLKGNAIEIRKLIRENERLKQSLTRNGIQYDHDDLSDSSSP